MVHTSVVFQPAIHYELQRVSKVHRKSMSAIVNEYIGKALAEERKAGLKHLYAELDKLDAIKVDGVTSATMDDLIYGNPTTHE